MASSLLEQTRALHEENEKLERGIVRDLQQETRSHRDRLNQSHRIKNRLNAILDNNTRLLEIYDDEDGARKDEVAVIGGQGGPGANVFSAFYDRLNEIRDYHRRHPGALVITNGPSVEDSLSEEPWLEFSGEEALGRHVDLHQLHLLFVNSRFGRPLEYAAYLEEVAQTHKIPRNLKFTKAYRDYMTALRVYLSSFFERTQPLQSLQRQLSKLQEDFEDRWEAGQVLSWEDRGVGRGALGAGRAAAAASGADEEEAEGAGQEAQGYGFKQEAVDLAQVDTVEELLDADVVPPEKLKEALAALGLKAGGTPRERAERLLLAKHTPFEAIPARHFSKSFAPPVKKPREENATRAVAKAVAWEEAQVARLCELLAEPLSATREHVEKKAALTFEEMAAEREEEEVHLEEESDEDEEAIYNPLKLPMGWDGKPIPYWLYKLHGLNQEFKCEICGNFSYWGRRAFERHFKEWRHQHGMRCLGIPNTNAFFEVTAIKEAQELWERIREKQGQEKFRPEVDEECEDREGNVYDKRTYTDLKRQGLI